jgi:CubicO group peptidase (beta-lactamase class C family)
MDRRSVLLSSGLVSAGLWAASADVTQAAPAHHHAAGLSISAEGTGAARYAAALKLIGAYAAQHVRDNGLPGLTLCCVDQDGFTGYVRVGLADLDRHVAVGPDHLFQVGSISKSFVGVMLHQLQSEGRLKLSDDIRQHLPDTPLPPTPPISLTNLLQHSSGLPDDAPVFPATPDGKLWSQFAPGTAWSYSNTGYELLGRVVAKLDGRSLAASLQARVFKPLGMTSATGEIQVKDRARYATGYRPFDPDNAFKPGARLGVAPWINFINGAGCVSATAADMTHWLRYLISAGSGHGAPLLNDGEAERYTAPGIDAPGWAVKGAHYGSGLAHVPVEGRTVLHHTGGMVAFSSAMHVDPIAGVGVFASSNIGDTGYRPRDLTAYACALLRAVRTPQKGFSPKPAPTAAKPPTTPPASPPKSDKPIPTEFAGLVGRYENSDPWVGTFSITARPDGLYIEDEVLLEHHPDGYWLPKAPVNTERLWFRNEMDGKAQTLIFSGKLLERRDL